MCRFCLSQWLDCVLTILLFSEEVEDSEDEGEDPALDSLSQAIAFQVLCHMLPSRPMLPFPLLRLNFPCSLSGSRDCLKPRSFHKFCGCWGPGTAA